MVRLGLQALKRIPPGSDGSLQVGQLSRTFIAAMKGIGQTGEMGRGRRAAGGRLIGGDGRVQVSSLPRSRIAIPQPIAQPV